MRVKFKSNQSGELQSSEAEDFVTGWLVGHSAWGRPVDVAVGTDVALYVSDDKTGTIYRISYAKSIKY